MSRLTTRKVISEEESYHLIAKNLYDRPIDKALNKLGRLEDIEDDIGVPMQLVYEALKKGGILVRNTQGLRRYTHHSHSYLTFGYDEYKGWYFTMRVKGLPQYFIKDYGKTWALTKEELKND